MLASASHSARAFVPAASFRGAPLVARNLRRPLYSNVCGNSNNAVETSGRGLKQQQRGLWIVQSAGRRQHGEGVRVVKMSSSSGVVREAQVEAGANQEWTAPTVRRLFKC